MSKNIYGSDLQSLPLLARSTPYFSPAAMEPYHSLRAILGRFGVSKPQRDKMGVHSPEHTMFQTLSRELENHHEPYEQTLRDAVEQITVIEVRGGVDAEHILIEFDVGRAAGPYTEHTLTIPVRDSDIAVTAEHIPHEWLAMGAGFIDTRLSRLAHTLLAELDKKALAARRLI